jgi:hypothetical protein
MNSQIHAHLVAHRIESRAQGAVNERLARELRRRRGDARRSAPQQRRLRVRVTARA